MHTHSFGERFCLKPVVCDLNSSVFPLFQTTRLKDLVWCRDASLRSFASHKEHSTLQSPKDRASTRKKKKRTQNKPTQNKTPETNKAEAQRLEAAA